MENHLMEPIILASSSPRRQEYFSLLGLPFSVVPAKIDESQTRETSPLKLTRELAVKKVERVIEMLKNRLPYWICGADTVVALDNTIFGKPASREEAGQMLKRLKGREHEVISSIALYNGRKGTIDCRSAACTVSFSPMTKAEIEWYLDTNEWQGAAGAYRIQQLASCFISRIKGSQTTVAGLPLRELYAMLRDNGYPYGA
jgi:septum formation protein